MSISKRNFLAAGTAAALGASGLAHAQAATLRFHQMLPAQATIPSRAIAPWIAKVEKESGGRLKIQQFNAMALGGTPVQLFDQARDGVVDITWTVLGYTAGRFNRCEVFELPFMTSGAESSSRAFQEYVEKNAMEEFKDVKLICVHTHGAGLFHTKEPVTSMEDLRGMKIRGVSRVISNLKKVIDDNSGMMAAAMFGKAMDEGDVVGLDIARKAGNRIIALDIAETQRWKRTAGTVETDWIKEMQGKGIDGGKLIAEARSLIDKYNK